MDSGNAEKPASGQSLQAETPILGQADESDKIRVITEACERKDVAELVKLANSTGGLLNDGLRKSACESFVRA